MTRALGQETSNPASPCLDHGSKPAIPKPSQVTFRRPTPCQASVSQARLLVMRLSPRFTQHGQQYTLIVWGSSENPQCIDPQIPHVDELTPFHDVREKEGVARARVRDMDVVVRWRLSTDAKALSAMCDILVDEHRRHPEAPLELYTPVVKFASAFCDTFAQVNGISWIQNYQSQVIDIDEFCAAFATQRASERQLFLALGESWAQYGSQEITGHAALPDQWRTDQATVHICADGSFSRKSGGASAFVTSLGDYCALPAKGSSILCCELSAIERAIEHARTLKGKVVIWSDSRLALSYIARLSSSTPYTVRNDMTRTLDHIDAELQFRRDNGYGPLVFRWIKAHTDISSLQRILNDGADRLARHTMRNICHGEFTDTLAGVCERIADECMTHLARLNPTTDSPIDTSENTFEEYEAPDDTDSCR